MANRYKTVAACCCPQVVLSVAMPPVLSVAIPSMAAKAAYEHRASKWRTLIVVCCMVTVCCVITTSNTHCHSVLCCPAAPRLNAMTRSA